jgi:hypothetical protein
LERPNENRVQGYPKTRRISIKIVEVSLFVLSPEIEDQD